MVPARESLMIKSMNGSLKKVSKIKAMEYFCIWDFMYLVLVLRSVYIWFHRI